MEEKEKKEILGRLEADNIGDLIPEDKKTKDWYYKPWIIVGAFIMFGPLALILVWFRPKTKLSIKITITVVVLILTIWFTKVSVDYYRALMRYFQQIAETLVSN